MSKVICPEPGSQLTVGSITFSPVTSNAAAGYPRPSFQEGYRRRGGLLELAQHFVIAAGNHQLAARISAELKED